MWVDNVQVRLRRLEEVVIGLKELAELDSTTSPKGLRDILAAERGLYLGADVLLDIGNHILTSQYGTSPEGYQDIIEQLASQGILDSGLHQRLRGLAGFRNILVHDYLRLDPDRVQEALARAPGDFDDFARAIRRWLESRTAP